METVTIQKLSKTYPSGKEALKQLSLTLSTGEVFGFLGSEMVPERRQP